MTTELAKDLKSLGDGSTYDYSGGIDSSVLERFPNPMPHVSRSTTSEIEIVAPEFTSLCPVTGQPDFAEIAISYSPALWCVESKSIKLYLGSFRESRTFHEAVVTRIHLDLWNLLQPSWLEVQGRFTPRGGIKFWPTIYKTV